MEIDNKNVLRFCFDPDTVATPRTSFTGLNDWNIFVEPCLFRSNTLTNSIEKPDVRESTCANNGVERARFEPEGGASAATTSQESHQGHKRKAEEIRLPHAEDAGIKIHKIHALAGGRRKKNKEAKDTTGARRRLQGWRDCI